MLDEYHWQFQGTGKEAVPESRTVPAPGWHFYEHSQTMAERLEDALGIHLTGSTANAGYDTVIGTTVDGFDALLP